VQYTRAARARRTWRGASSAALAALIALADRIGHEHAWPMRHSVNKALESRSADTWPAPIRSVTGIAARWTGRDSAGAPLRAVEGDAAIPQRDPCIVADDEVVEQVDVEKATGGQRLCRQVKIVGRRRRVGPCEVSGETNLGVSPPNRTFVLRGDSDYGADGVWPRPLRRWSHEVEQVSRPQRDVGHRPTCEENHPGSRVHIDRTIRRSSSGYNEGLGFRCVWDGGRHLVKRPSMPRTMTAAHPSTGKACPGCGIKHDHGGPTVAADFTYTVLEQGRALVRLGQGAKYSVVAQEMRQAALRPRGAMRLKCLGRKWSPRQPVDPLARLTQTKDYDYRTPKPAKSKDGPYSKSATTVTSMLDIFAPPILQAFAPQELPKVLALDSKPLKRRRWVVDEVTGVVSRASGGETNGEVMVVGDPTTSPTRPILIMLEGGKDSEAWKRTFARLPEGKDPEWVVADLDWGIEIAVRDTWPDATLYRSERHLRARIKAALQADGIPERVSGAAAKRLGVVPKERSTVRARRNAITYAYHPLQVLAAKSLKTPEDWAALKAGVEASIPKKRGQTRKWIRANDALILAQFDLKAKYPDMPKSAGGVEAIITQIGEAIEKRSEYFTNAARLDSLLGLIRLAIVGAADDVRYSEIITDFLAEREGAGIDWRSPRDVLGMSSIDDLIDFAFLEAKKAEVQRDSDRRLETQQRRTTEIDAQRAAAGLLPTKTGLYRRPDKVGEGDRDSRGRIYYPFKRGQMLSDIPGIRDQWLPELNGGKRADEVRAGSRDEGVWACNAHEARGHLHIWKRPIIDRVTNRSACRMCAGKEPCVLTSLQAQYPDLAAEWSPKNGSLTPDKVMPGNNTSVFWKCANKKHPIFELRISTRTKQHAGCRRCFLERRWGGPKNANVNRAKAVGRAAVAASRIPTRPPVAPVETDDEVAADGVTFTPDEAAKVLGRSVQTITNWVKAGRLQGRNVGTATKAQYRISAAQVDRAAVILGLVEAATDADEAGVGPGDPGWDENEPNSEPTWFVGPDERIGEPPV
jgi:excisionase family DNA binding protein